MEEQIKQIAQRLRGLRDALDISIADIAETCHISMEDYKTYESGTVDIPMNFICQMANAYHVQPSALISGNETAYMSSYFLTRKDKGISVERQKAYKYQSLGMGFKNAKAEPFIVTVEPNDTPKEDLHLNSHPEQEFNMVLEGTLLLVIDGKELILNEGDSIYFDSTQPHAMKALNNKRVRFFAIIM